MISTSTNSICTDFQNVELFLFLYPEKCPDDDANYALIEGVCYFFDKGKKWHSMAQENCNNHIVNGARGRLFEPRSLATNDLVFYNFTSIHGNQSIYIGLDAHAHKYTWVYSSSGEQAMFTNWAESEPSSSIEPCAHFNKNHPTWSDWRCDWYLASICEFRSGNTWQG